MTKDKTGNRKKQDHRHLTLLEVITIAEAVQRGEKVAMLANQFDVYRQTIYNAVQTVKEKRIPYSNNNSMQSVPTKRRLTTRIAPEVCQQLIELKQKYPIWDVKY